ncbi:NinE family protein [Salmonella enterica subsp. enterica]|nr:NinE family protein [Salmonella enterica subsp. enterica]EDT2869550.1 NinE family protein [Salmonella enterica subsp. enterica serovar Bere]EDV0347661.1 NinE family protein [Salmonella enterica subsp. enterica]EEJ0350678.1 NinE family protein [Salmonella enterica subsp. enterica]EEJ2508796.1 NinE family protein [Salmonella enterica subsp. arizonae serovar 47:z4,z23:-]
MARQRRSITQIAIDNLIFKVPHRKKRQPEVPPSQIPSFDYSSHLADVRWLRICSRRRKEHAQP